MIIKYTTKDLCIDIYIFDCIYLHIIYKILIIHLIYMSPIQINLIYNY